MSHEDSVTDESLRLTSSKVYQIIAVEGQEELERPLFSLGWSGLVAGLCITFSLFCEGYMRHHLPEGNFFLVENIGYTFGFIIVIIGRLQLFTENTITVVIPLLERRSVRNFIRTCKLWLTVLTTNFIGTFIVALLVTKFNLLPDDLLATCIEISVEAVDKPFMSVFTTGIPAGFLIACLVWMLPSSRRGGNEFWIILMMTYIIAIGDFSHIVAGSVEAFILWLEGMISLQQTLGYLLGACLGNIVGGTFLFTMMAYNQVKGERYKSS
ncbi:MAG: formate/nitrite transporter family protein [Alphaproteobacteria bacterium]